MSDTNQPAPKKKKRFAVAFAFFVCMLPFATVLFSKLGLDKYRGIRTEMRFLRDSIQLADFKGLTANGDTLRRDDLDGRIVVFHFFRGALNPADPALLELRRVQREYDVPEDQNKIRFVSCSLDPRPDSGAVISQVAGFDTVTWKPLSLDAASLQALLGSLRLDANAAPQSLTLVNSGGYLCQHYLIQADSINQLMIHMTIVIPKKDRKRIAYQADTNLYHQNKK